MRRLRAGEDDGFSLVEILVSIVIAGLVAAAVLPLLLSGMMAGNVAKSDTQAKALAQERLEQMRNLPFYVAFDSGDYSDVLDIYFRDESSTVAAVTPAGRNPCSARGYVAGTKSYVCQLPARQIGVTTFTQRVETTFRNASNAVVTPRTGYKSYQSLVDTPASSLLGVVIRTDWQVGEKTKSYTLRSSIARTNGEAPLITSRFRGSALRVTSTVGADTLQFETGVVSAEGSKSTASTAAATAVGAIASLASGSTVRGANATLQAPADDVRGTQNGAASDLDGAGCLRVCFGPTTVKDGVAATVSTGVPVVGETSPGLRLRAALTRTGAADDRGFGYSNATAAQVLETLAVPALPIVSAQPTTTGSVAEATGHVNAVSSGTTSVTSSVSAKTQEIQLFRTTEAPGGIVQVVLTTASLQCTDLKSGSPTVTSDWDATVRVWDGTGYGTYTYQIKKGSTVSLPNQTAREAIVVAPGKTLANYISSWDSVNPAAVNQSADDAKAQIPAVISILTSPTRLGDASSALNIAVGSLSCDARDNQ